MITRADDFPVHQTADPVAYPATSDRNFYDRYFFHGYDKSGNCFFAVALGFYPNRLVADAALNVVWNGQQHILHASQSYGGERWDVCVGPINVQVLEPLQNLRVTIDKNPSGLTADLRFNARTIALEEPRFQQRSGPRLWMDYTRMTQLGRWSGWLQIGDRRLELAPDSWLGARDRSWGIRPLGEPEGGAPAVPWQFFWLWAPIHFPEYCVHFDVNEYSDGTRWHEFGAIVHSEPTAPAPSVRAAQVSYNLRLRKGTRQVEAATFTLREPSGEPLVITLEPQLHLYMAGLGYGHPEWGHGRFLGDHVVASETWDLSTLDPSVPMHFHVQSLCRVRAGREEGIGVLEQLFIGPHRPTGLTGLFDPAS